MKTDLLKIEPRNFRDEILPTETILSWLENQDAFWQYWGEPNAQRPHARLSSGKCSNGFFDCLRILCFPNISEILAQQLAQKIRPALNNFLGKNKSGQTSLWVISSAYAALTFGHDVARELGAAFMFVEKDCNDPKGKRMTWQRMSIPAGARVIQIEELITTSDTFKEVRRAVQESNEEIVQFAPFVGTIIHRPEKIVREYNGIQVISLVERQVSNYSPEACIYCRVGSKPLKPKKNWKELTGKY